MARRSVPLLALLLAGCMSHYSPVTVTVGELRAPPLIPGLDEPNFAAATFVTATEVALRDEQEEHGARIVAVLPPGTPVVPSGSRGEHCICWHVKTPLGNGWLYTSYLALRLPADS